MIKVFTLNKNNKIELTEKELKALLDEAYWEGYRNGSNTTWTYTSPGYDKWNPYYYTTCTNATTGTITLTSTTASDINTYTNNITAQGNK